MSARRRGQTGFWAQESYDFCDQVQCRASIPGASHLIFTAPRLRLVSYDWSGSQLSLILSLITHTLPRIDFSGVCMGEHEHETEMSGPRFKIFSLSSFLSLSPSQSLTRSLSPPSHPPPPTSHS